MCFQETKLDSINSVVVKSLWSSPFVDWVALDAIHTARGVILAWDTRVYKKMDVLVRCFSVSILFMGVVDNFDWICTGVYGPNSDGLRDALWTKLDSVKGRWNVAWCVFGDFNIIRYPAKRLGCTSFSPAMFKFSDFIERNFFMIYLWLGASIHGSVTQRTLLCLELIECWYLLIRRITFWI